MSFDLFFFWRRQEPIDFNSVIEWSHKFPHFQREHDSLWYKNENTGVYFNINFDIKDKEDSVIPPEWLGYFDSALSFNLNYNRPSFFADEAMPVVLTLAAEFGLTIYDCQHDHPNSPKQNPVNSELIKS